MNWKLAFAPMCAALLCACGDGGGGDDDAQAGATYNLDAAVTTVFTRGYHGVAGLNVDGRMLTAYQVFRPSSDVLVNGSVRKVVARTTAVQLDGNELGRQVDTIQFTAAPLRLLSFIDPNVGTVTPTWLGDLPTAATVGTSGNLMDYSGIRVRWTLKAHKDESALACLDYTTLGTVDCYYIRPNGEVLGWQYTTVVGGRTYALK